MLAHASICLAWDGIPTGTINVIDVTAGDNAAFRVWTRDAGPHCTGGASWAYLNESDSNYTTYVATLLLARSLGQQVVLYTTAEADGVCRIGHLALPS